MIRTVVVTISDRSAAGEREDLSGPAVVSLLDAAKFEVVRTLVVPDDRDAISTKLRRTADTGTIDLILTTGGTGLSPRDVTPEATAAICDRLVPGLPELMRAATLKATPFAALSRAICGVRGATLILNLPGSPKGVRETLAVVLPILPHAVATLRGEASDASHHAADRPTVAAKPTALQP